LGRLCGCKSGGNSSRTAHAHAHNGNRENLDDLDAVAETAEATGCDEIVGVVLSGWNEWNQMFFCEKPFDPLDALSHPFGLPISPYAAYSLFFEG
jgi:hypothetical protein